MIVPIDTVAHYLDARHYLGRARRGFAWSDEFGVMVLGAPSSRHIPTDWLELSRWCLEGTPNGGSMQWARVVRWLKENRADVTTVVSYSDPSVGHTGALYKACNWVWAPTWQRLRPPPTGNGSWNGTKIESVKDRWVYPIRKDARRSDVLAVKDASLLKRGCYQYSEPPRFRDAA